MKPILIAVLALNLFSALVNKPTSSIIAPQKATAFYISSLGTSFAFAGVFDGEYSIKAQAIEINLNKAVIYLRDNTPYKGRRRLAAFRVGLAAETSPGKWDIVRKSPDLPVDKIMSPGDKFMVEQQRFSIPIEQAMDLEKYWLVFEIDDIASETGRAVGHDYAQSEHNIFAKKAATVPGAIYSAGPIVPPPVKIGPTPGLVPMRLILG